MLKIFDNCNLGKLISKSMLLRQKTKQNNFSFIFKLLFFKTEILMYDIEVHDDTGKTLRSVRIPIAEHTVHEWINSVVMLTHKPSGLRSAAVILKAKNHSIAVVKAPPNHNISRRGRDFFIEIYGVTSTGKIVIYYNGSLGDYLTAPIEQKTIDPAVKMVSKNEETTA